MFIYDPFAKFKKLELLWTKEEIQYLDLSFYNPLSVEINLDRIELISSGIEIMLN
jgi:hypothetical protein